jgi:translation initiation factor 5
MTMNSMPLLMTKIEGKGNGIKTVIPNMSDVARALSRPPSYPTKFFGCELGAQTTFDDKTERYIVNGAHDATRMRELLDVFIDKFVLCKSCKNPETDLIITKTEDIVRDCKACGQRTDIDMRHKLTTFILKNPPKKAKKAKGKSGNAAEGTSGMPGTPPVGGDDGTPGGDGGADSDDELSRRLKAEAADLKVESKLDDWSADTSEEAVKARTKAMEAAMGAMALNDDDDEGEDENSPYGQLGAWATENREDATPAEVYKKVDELGIAKKHKSLQILMQTLFTENIVAELPKFAPVLAKVGGCKLCALSGHLHALQLGANSGEKQQKSLLGGVEVFTGVMHPDLIPAVPKILMALYQVDLLDEDTVKQWGTHVSKKYTKDKEISKKVRKASEPFLKVSFRLCFPLRPSANCLLSGSKRLMMMMMMMMTTTTTMSSRSRCLLSSISCRSFHKYKSRFSP